MTDPAPISASEDKPLNVGVLATTFIVGVCIAGLGVVANVHWHWKDIWQYVFLDVGSAIALGSGLFVLQRKFVADVGRNVRDAVNRQTESIDRRFDEQSNRIEDLAERIAGVRSRRRADSNASIEIARTAPSSENLAEALIRAMNVNGISSRLRVRASDDLEGLRFVVQYIDDRNWTDKPVISFDAVSIDSGYSGRQIIPWMVGEDVDEFAARLFDALEGYNIPTDPVNLDLLGVFNRIVDATELVLASRAGEIEPRIAGRLVEILNGDWLITDEAVCSRNSSLTLGVEHFFDYQPGYGQARPLAPPPPDGTDPDIWSFVVRAAHGCLPRPSVRKGFSGRI